MRPGIPLTLLIGYLVLTGGCAPRPNIVLITIDTLRRDAVGVYAPAVTWTPTLDSLAHAGTLWFDAYAPFSMTQPSHAAMMTGRYPAEFGLNSNESVVPKEADCLAEELTVKGYDCGAFVNSWVLDTPSGLGQGFRFYQAVRDERGRVQVVKENESLGQARVGGRASRSVEMATRWFGKAGRPFFLWVHLMDPHLPYDPPEQALRHLGSRPINRDLGAENVWRVRRGEGGGFTPEERRDIALLYAGEVAAVDQSLGDLFAHMRSVALHENTIVVVVSDHGESILDDGGYIGHAHSLHDAVTRIPLVMAGRGIPEGLIIREPVELVQLKPTLRRLAGLSTDTRNGDLFSRLARVPLTMDAAGRMTGVWQGWKVMRRDTHSVPQTIHRGSGDSLMASARVDSAFSALLLMTAHGEEQSLSAEDEAALRALGYLE